MICPYYNYYLNYRNFLPSNPISVGAKEIKHSDSKIHEHLRIPIVRGNISPKVLEFINSNLENDIMEFKTQMENAAEENVLEKKKLSKPVVPYNISNIFSLTYNRNNIVSITITYNEIIDEKTYYVRTTYNYDITNGKSLSVMDLFKPGIDAKRIIDDEVRREIASNPQGYFPGALKNFKGIAEDQPFYLEDNNLVLFFSFNEIAPVASDIPVIKMPLARFGNYIKPQFLRHYSYEYL